MPILTEDMKRVVAEPRLCFYATVCEFAKSGVKGGVRGRCAQTPGLDDTQSSASAPSTRPLSHVSGTLARDRFGQSDRRPATGPWPKESRPPECRRHRKGGVCLRRDGAPGRRPRQAPQSDAGDRCLPREAKTLPRSARTRLTVSVNTFSHQYPALRSGEWTSPLVSRC